MPEKIDILNTMIVACDIETTGLDPDNNQILELGAAIWDISKPLNLETIPQINYVVKHDVYIGSPFALQLNQRIFKVLAFDNGSDEYQEIYNIISSDWLMASFKEWLSDHGVDTTKHIVFAGKNFGAFDLQFIKKLNYDLLKISHRFIDPGNLYWCPAIDGSKLPDLNTCLKRAGVNRHITHKAVDDAKDVLTVINARIDMLNGWNSELK